MYTGYWNPVVVDGAGIVVGPSPDVLSSTEYSMRWAEVLLAAVLSSPPVGIIGMVEEVVGSSRCWDTVVVVSGEQSK